LFATHYQRIDRPGEIAAGREELNVAVREWQDDVVFLHKIVEGAPTRATESTSPGWRGVPRAVIERSKDILAQLEEEHLDASGRAKIARPVKELKKTHLQLTLFGPADHPLLDELRRMDLNNVTPIQAIQLLQRCRRSWARRKPFPLPPERARVRAVLVPTLRVGTRTPLLSVTLK